MKKLIFRHRGMHTILDRSFILLSFIMQFMHVESFSVPVKNHKCRNVTCPCRKAQLYTRLLNVQMVRIKSELTVSGRLFQ